MHAAFSTRCLTRVIVDDSDVEVAQIHDAKLRIHEALRAIPLDERDYIADALLRLAVLQTFASTVAVRAEVS
jgi:hypothetical protein